MCLYMHRCCFCCLFVYVCFTLRLEGRRRRAPEEALRKLQAPRAGRRAARAASRTSGGTTCLTLLDFVKYSLICLRVVYSVKGHHNLPIDSPRLKKPCVRQVISVRQVVPPEDRRAPAGCPRPGRLGRRWPRASPRRLPRPRPTPRGPRSSCRRGPQHRHKTGLNKHVKQNMA